MAVYNLRDAGIYVEGYNLSSQHNAGSLTWEATGLESTTMGATFRTRIAGLMDVALSLDGHWDAGTALPDTVFASEFAAADTVTTIIPETAAVAGAAYALQALLLEYAPGGGVGEVLAFTVRGSGTLLVPSTILAVGAKTATGTGTALQLGAVGATEYLYGSLHVVAASGTSPTLDVVIQSDDAQGFASATPRITFSEKSAVGAQWGTAVAGAITDDWWRVSYTIGGTNDPAFTFLVTMGIR